MAVAAGQALAQASATQAQVQELRKEVAGALHQQAVAAQTQTAEHGQRLREEVASMLRKQLGAAQEGATQWMDAVA